MLRSLLPLALLIACSDPGHLRGEVASSNDGQTYLAIDDDNGGQCGDLIVDGRVWPHPVGTPGRIQPGVHAIDCGSLDTYDPSHAIRFEIPRGMIFRFNYWGP
ncbi:MAG: hypothetical protein AAGE52_17160 [Myxococcota bacterium]